MTELDPSARHRTSYPHPRVRSAAGLRATDGLKMGCPFCGDATSAVIWSHGVPAADQVRRRRECAECARRFPTSERIDYESLERELVETGEWAIEVDVMEEQRTVHAEARRADAARVRCIARPR